MLHLVNAEVRDVARIPTKPSGETDAPGVERENPKEESTQTGKSSSYNQTPESLQPNMKLPRTNTRASAVKTNPTQPQKSWFWIKWE